MSFRIAFVAAAAALSIFGAAAASPSPLGEGRGEGRRPLLTLYDAPGVTRACEQGRRRERVDAAADYGGVELSHVRASGTPRP